MSWVRGGAPLLTWETGNEKALIQIKDTWMSIDCENGLNLLQICEYLNFKNQNGESKNLKISLLFDLANRICEV